MSRQNIPALLTALLAALALPSGGSRFEGLNYTVSWIGNSYSGKTGWVLQNVDGICVTPDGSLFTNTSWDEGGGNVQEYRDGRLLHIAGHTHGWGYEGGEAIAANTKYLFIAQRVSVGGGTLKGDSWPPSGSAWLGVSRRLRADTRFAASFAGGHGKEGDVLKSAFLPVATVPNEDKRAIRGICASEKQLFVNNPIEKSIQVFDTETMKQTLSWSVERADRICLDSSGGLWVLQRPDKERTWQATRFTAEGKPLRQQIVFPARTVPADIYADRKNRLLVADNGPDQQIKIYADITGSPHLTGAFGVKGGILAAPPGLAGSGRFNQPTGVGADDAGNLYVASNGSTGGGGAALECYAPTGALRWRRLGLTFADMADADPRTGTDVYTKDRHFTVDYSKSGGPSWEYRGYTVNQNKYPDDPRLHIPGVTTWVRIIKGKKFLFVADRGVDSLQVYRFAPQTDGEIAVPCGLISKKHFSAGTAYPPHQPAKGEWIWSDKNGDGKMDADEFQSNGGADAQGVLVPIVPDERGTLWQVTGSGIRAIPVKDVTAKGVPVWDFADARVYPKPPELDAVRRLRYLPEQDIMLLGGNRGEEHNQHWKPMGPILCCYTGWSTGKPVLKQRATLPYEKGASGHISAEPISFDVAGNYVFVSYTHGLKAEGTKNAFVKTLRLSDLSPVGNLSAEATLGETGLLDMVEPERALRLAGGEYVIFMEDDLKAKVIMFLWKPR